MSRWSFDWHFRPKRWRRHKEWRPTIEYIFPEPKPPTESRNEMLCPIVLRPLTYDHVATARSVTLLAELPIEIIDTILSFLEERDWRIARRTNSILKASAQALIYREVEFFDFRPPQIRKKSMNDGFFRMITEQPALQNHVKALRLRSLVDPTRQADIAKFIVRALSNLKQVRTVTICFSDGTASLKSFLETLEILRSR